MGIAEDRVFLLGLLIQYVEEGLSTLQILCKPHPRLRKIGEMFSDCGVTAV